jgi:fumarylacetoacetase
LKQNQIKNKLIKANDPSLKSWIEVDENSDFPIQNLPFGIFKTNQDEPRVGSRVGDKVIDLNALYVLGYFQNLPFTESDFQTDALNSIMKKGKTATTDLRNRLSKLFTKENTDLFNNKNHVDQVLNDADDLEMLLPVQVGDYTDFYSSRGHATNVGTLFRDPANALLPNWLWIPVGYHGRASSIIPSNQIIHRPKGQTKPNDDQDPVFGASKLVDFELEMAFVTFDGKPLGENITTAEASEYIFGMCIMNDWSARDIQKWEYVPLGPFLGKNFATSISPWVVTLDALEPFRVAAPKQDPKVLDYLARKEDWAVDLKLAFGIQTPNMDKPEYISHTNFKYMYWDIAQQLTHHSINGCAMNTGDLYGSGTISGPTADSYGSMIEMTEGGKNPIKLSDGTERVFLKDGDTAVITGFCQADGYRVGFGSVSGKIFP